MTPFLSSTCSSLTVYNTNFIISKWSKFIFMWPALWSILVCKYFNFEQKLPILTAHHTFLERRHSVTKNPYYVLSPRRSQKKASAHGLIPVCRGAYSPFLKTNPPIFCCPLFSENYLNPQTRINKMVNKHTINHHPSPSELISRIHPLIFLSNPKAFICPESYSVIL